LEINNFTRIIYKVGCGDYASTVSKLSSLYHLAEYETVKQGVRKATTIHIDSPKLIERVNEIERDGLVFTPLRASGYFQGFGGHKPVIPDKPFYYYGCVTRTHEDGVKFKTADTRADHRIIGELLGYPKCCTEYFSTNFSTNTDPMWLNDTNFSGYYECNDLLKYFGIRVGGHFSCSPRCLDTKIVNGFWIELMKKLDPETTNSLIELLNSDMTWDSYHGVVEIKTPYFMGEASTFPLMQKRIIHYSSGGFDGRL
jgi:hypothetical protein